MYRRSHVYLMALLTIMFLYEQLAPIYKLIFLSNYNNLNTIFLIVFFCFLTINLDLIALFYYYTYNYTQKIIFSFQKPLTHNSYTYSHGYNISFFFLPYINIKAIVNFLLRYFLSSFYFPS